MLTADTNAAETVVCQELTALSCAFTRAQLPVGDFRVDGAALVVIVERKRVDDYRASILDGRLNSQKKRMASLVEESTVPTKCVVVVEGDRVGWGIGQNTHGITDRAMSGSFVRSWLRDGIPCLFTASPQETASLLVSIVDFVGSKASRPSANLGKRPRALALESPTVTLLSSVPSIGKAAASALAVAFPSASALVNASHAQLSLTSINSKRKLGPKAATVVKTFFS